MTQTLHIIRTAATKFWIPASVDVYIGTPWHGLVWRDRSRMQCILILSFIAESRRITADRSFVLSAARQPLNDKRDGRCFFPSTTESAGLDSIICDRRPVIRAGTAASPRTWHNSRLLRQRAPLNQTTSQAVAAPVVKAAAVMVPNRYWPLVHS